MTFTGTAGGTKVGTVTGSGTTYNVAVTGMTGTGTVIASLNASVATDAAGNGNAASTSTDNTVTYDTTAPTATVTLPSTTPLTAAPATVSGTAYDLTSGVSSIVVRYSYTSGSTYYWTGSAWSTTATNLTTTCSSGCNSPGATANWTVSSALPGSANLTNNTAYTLSAQSTDAATNVSFWWLFAFTYEPSITLTLNSTGTPAPFDPGTPQTWQSNLSVDTRSSGGFTLAANRIATGLVSLAGATVTNLNHPSFNSANTIDGNTTTVGWSGDAPINATISIDLGTAVAIPAVRIYADATGFPCWYNIERSSDGSSYITTGTIINPYDAGWNVVTVSDGSFRYWRIRLTSSCAGYTQTFTEIALDNPEPTLVSGANSIPDMNPWAGAGTSAAFPGEALGFRVHCNGTTGGYAGPNYTSAWWGAGGTCTTADAGSALYAGFPTGAQIIAQNTTYTSVAQTVLVDYRLSVSSIQPSGTYTGQVLYTASTTP